MTNEERDLITRFIERVGGAGAQRGGFAGSAPAGAPNQAPLPPVDKDADALIADLFNAYPEARYRITQMAFVQEHALVEAQNRINRLQWELQQAHQAAQSPAGQPQGSPWGAGQPQQSRGFFSNLFGGGGPQPAPPPQQPQYAPPPPQYPPNFNPGMFQQAQGSGFLGGALRTAAGVAGGVLAAEALTSMFSGHHGGGLFGGEAQAAEMPGGAEYVPVEPAASPWGGPSGTDPYDVGGAPKDDGGYDKFGGPGVTDNTPWQSPDQSGSWDDHSGDPGGDPGWDDSGSDDNNF
jgi:hypothetical protein